MISASFPYEKKRQQVFGLDMSYVEVGSGDPIVFLHGNPTSSYLWPNILPYTQNLGRCIVPDLIGMGDSEKLPNSGPDSYTFVENRRYLDTLLDQLNVRQQVTFVLHDWGSALGFDWAYRHPDAVKGIAYMEGIIKPRSWSEEEMTEYRRPFLQPGEGRRPTLTWPRQLPFDGDPVDVTNIVNIYGEWMAQNSIPKLFVNCDPGTMPSTHVGFCRTWLAQTEIIARGRHYPQEDSPEEIGIALAAWLKKLSL